MRTLRYRSRGEAVHVLEELLSSLGYSIRVTKYFGKDTHRAILDFQKKNKLVVDGIVGMKTWSKLLEKEISLTKTNNKLLSEDDLKKFAENYDLELAVVKAVNQIESSGKGFLVSGKPRILFEGHIFWKQLDKRGIQPSDYVNSDSENVLYKRWTRIHYLGGSREYERLEQAAALSTKKAFSDAAYSSASWGAFQIMGYHYEALGYESINKFVSDMSKHEREHLKAFGKFLEVNNLIRYLKKKDWKRFARGYNGSGYAQNKYDTKLAAAYLKFSSLA